MKMQIEQLQMTGPAARQMISLIDNPVELNVISVCDSDEDVMTPPQTPIATQSPAPTTTHTPTVTQTPTGTVSVSQTPTIVQTPLPTDQTPPISTPTSTTTQPPTPPTQTATSNRITTRPGYSRQIRYVPAGQHRRVLNMNNS